MARYLMTARRKAALRKAQLASARKRRKSGRQAKKIAKYGASRKTATIKQITNRNNRAANRIAAGYLAARFIVPVAYGAYSVRRANASVAYNGVYRDDAGRVFNAQGGPRILRVKPTARGARRRNRADFRAQYGRKTLRQLKRNTRRTQRMQRRNVRNAVRYGSTTMTWGPRQRALPRGR